MSKNERITHKELLTFSNLTNLEWQFADFKKKNNDMELDSPEESEYKK